MNIKNTFLYQLIDFWSQKLRYRGVCKVEFGAHVKHRSYFEGRNVIGEYTVFKGSLGLGSYLEKNCNLSAQIGRFSSIAPHVICNPGIHSYKAPFASTSPFFFDSHRKKKLTFASEDTMKFFRRVDDDNSIDVQIGNDCWIGEGAFLVGGIHIGDGAVVLARAVVTHDVEPYAIVGGVPARVIGYRYDKETIKFLLHRKWWDESEDWLRENWKLLTDIEALKASSTQNIDKQ